MGLVLPLGYTVSILASQVLGQSNVLGTEGGWPGLLMLTAVPAVLVVLGLSLCPESPKCLLMDKGDRERARESLLWFRDKKCVVNELALMIAEFENTKLLPRMTLRKMLTESSLRRPLGIAIMMQMTHQLTGIGAILFFSTSIFLNAELSLRASQTATLLLGVTQVVMTLVSLALVDRCGRRVLMLTGLSGMAVSNIMLYVSLSTVSSVPGMSYVSVLSVYLCVLFYFIGPGSIPWFYVGELFTQASRPMAMAVSGVVSWAANFVVVLSFPLLEHWIHQNVFVVFVVIQASLVLYVWRFVPETRGKTVEEVVAIFGKNRYNSLPIIT